MTKEPIQCFSWRNHLVVARGRRQAIETLADTYGRREIKAKDVVVHNARIALQQNEDSESFDVAPSELGEYFKVPSIIPDLS